METLKDVVDFFTKNIITPKTKYINLDDLSNLKNKLAKVKKDNLDIVNNIIEILKKQRLTVGDINDIKMSLMKW